MRPEDDQTSSRTGKTIRLEYFALMADLRRKKFVDGETELVPNAKHQMRPMHLLSPLRKTWSATICWRNLTI